MINSKRYCIFLCLIVILAFAPIGCTSRNKNPPPGNKADYAAAAVSSSAGKSSGDALSADKSLMDYKLKPFSKDKTISIKISAAGDCTLGTDETFGYAGSFLDEYEKHGEDMSYFFRNVRSIFSGDDITLVNLETPLTTADKKADKKYRFKGLPRFVDILKSGSVEAVNVANNHSYDYLKQGYDDTISCLNSAKIGIFGLGSKFTAVIKGISIGALGYTGWSNDTAARDRIKKDIQDMRNAGIQIVIVNFHWGIERDNYPNATQKGLGRFTIDAGADLVIGEHPHVIQGIENYKGKYIVYSLGNFCFGGNKNPSDKDTFIFQQTFEFNGGIETGSDINIIPCSISSVKTRNNYQPTPLSGADKSRVLNRLDQYSKGLNFETGKTE